MAVTVSGPVPDADLGIVAIHERLFWGLEGWEDDPSVIFDRPKAFEDLLAALAVFRRAGGRTLVDTGGTFGGRRPDLIASLAAASGVHIVASSGFAAEPWMPGHFTIPLSERALRVASGPGGEPPLWIPDADYLAELILGELNEGMVSPGMMRSAARAGAVSAACRVEPAGESLMSEFEVLGIRAAAIAARRSGAAVFLHGNTQASRMLDMVSAEGLAPDRVVISHCDDARAVDAQRDRQLAARGAYIGYDHAGWQDASAPHAMSDERRVELVKALVDVGLAERVLVSCSAIGCGLGMTATRHGFSYLLTDFVPRLTRAGLGDAVIQTLLVDNPGRVLAGSSR